MKSIGEAMGIGRTFKQAFQKCIRSMEIQRPGFGLDRNDRLLLATRQQPIPLVYHGVHIEVGFRADLIVEELVIVEIKSVEVVAPVHKKQLLTHLRLANKRLGLLINFNVALIKDGITRVANGLSE
jgi:GxxExxY protein